jgi:hypothetical protein
MNINIEIESTHLKREWDLLALDPSLSPKKVFKAPDAEFRIRVDSQTKEWILELEFPSGGPTPEIIKTLMFVKPEEATVESPQKRRLLTIRYDPAPSHYLAPWPHFAETICSAAAKVHPKTKCAESVNNTFKEWRNYWPGTRKLSPDKFQGLFGELVFLDELLKKLPPELAIEAWHGPNARDHDFGIQKIALEVKASAGKKNKVKISNLDQLNDAGLDDLYIVTVLLRHSNDKRHSLQEIRDSIVKNLNSEPEQLKTMFTHKLTLAGYDKAPETQRMESGFRQLGIKVYRIKEGFPRILKEDLMQFGPGVDVKEYYINLDTDTCRKFLLNDSEKNELWSQLQLATRKIGDRQT